MRKGYFQGQLRSRGARLLPVVILMVTFPVAAFATLGGPAESVRNDQAQMRATLRTTALEAYMVHELTLPVGTVVREYVSPSGKVFAISWQGAFVPDMKQLLGPYFGRYSKAAKQRRDFPIEHQHLDLHQPSLVVQSSGHMRFYSGRAYDPQLLPEGVNADVLR